MRCAACGTENRADRKFCAECGAGLARACPSCGAANLAGERFCGDCGRALTDHGRGRRRSCRPVGAAADIAADGTAAPSAASCRSCSSTWSARPPSPRRRDPEAVRELLGG